MQKQKSKQRHPLRRVKLERVERLPERESVIGSFGGLYFTVPSKQAHKAAKEGYNVIKPETFKKRRAFMGY